MILPQITYNDYDAVNNPTGGAVTLTFLYPPTSKPLFNKTATRTDTFSTAGNRQSVLQRVNESYPIQMQTILAGTDSAAWQRFLNYAVLGGDFNYYPDVTTPANQGTYYVCFLLETEAQLAFISSGIYTFKGTFQKEIS
jgi:hypothetical protein